MTTNNFPSYSEGICEDGAAILCDGIPMTIEQILTKLNNTNKLIVIAIKHCPKDHQDFRKIISLIDG